MVSKTKPKSILTKVAWVSLGNFPIEPSSVETLSFCQGLERRGYGLRGQCGSTERVDPWIAVVLPNGRVVEENKLDDFAMQHKGPLRTTSQKIMWDAYRYVRGYRSA